MSEREWLEGGSEHEHLEGLSLSGARPETPNEHWLAGEQARREGVLRSTCPLAYPGSRWEWEAGWDYANAKGDVPLSAEYEVPGYLRGAGDGTTTPADRCSLCLCGLNIKGLCVDPLCPGSREDDDDYFRRINA